MKEDLNISNNSVNEDSQADMLSGSSFVVQTKVIIKLLVQIWRKYYYYSPPSSPADRYRAVFYIALMLNHYCAQGQNQVLITIDQIRKQIGLKFSSI